MRRRSCSPPHKSCHPSRLGWSCSPSAATFPSRCCRSSPGSCSPASGCHGRSKSAHALRVHADLLRSRRRQRAEERAAKASVKLVFPLVFCLFPAFYLIALGPALLQVVHVFFSAVANFE